MNIGIFLPYTEIDPDPGYVREFAQTAEAVGYSHLLVPDHPVRGLHELGREGGRMATMFDPFVLLAHLSAMTTRLELATSVLILPQRQTVLVAKQAAEVDLLSGGRLRLGIGTGAGPRLEYDAMGSEYESRGRRQEEQVRLLRQLWSNDTVRFDGEFHHIEKGGIHPRPMRDIPIWFGGGDAKNPQTAERALRRAARLGDGWMPLFRPDEPESVAARDRLYGYLREAGRDPAAFEIEGFTSVRSKDPSCWRERVQAWREFGATRVALRAMGVGLSPRDHIEILSRYMDAVRDETAAAATD